MTRSLAAGDYTLVTAIESASRPQSFYRVCQSRHDGSLSCDCPAWTFNHDGRTCKHTDAVAPLVRAATTRPTSVASLVDARHPLIAATRHQWPGLAGAWNVEERESVIDRVPYHFVLISLQTPNGDIASGMVAFATRHHTTIGTTVAAWAGYAIAAELCRRANMPLIGTPPQHYITPKRTGTRVLRPGAAPTIGLADILRIGENENLGDGLTPAIRAENTLRLFLGDMFTTLERQGFLDVSSRAYPQRVYRIRRDPAKHRERRVRVFENGNYTQDFCIVRAQTCPADDHFLTVFLGLISDERGTLSVVKRHNVFGRNSDGSERETVPAVWQPALAA